MRKSRVFPTLLIAGLGFLGSLAGASPGRAQDWICQELQGSECLNPYAIFCFWSEEEVGYCDCQENGTYACYHNPQVSAASAGIPLQDFLATLQTAAQ